MTGGRNPIREEAFKAYKDYVRPVIEDPLDDRKLTYRGLREHTGLANDTIKKYGLNERLKRVDRWRMRIPSEEAHPFRRKRPTHSDGRGPPIPTEEAHLFRRKRPTPFGELGRCLTEGEADAG